VFVAKNPLARNNVGTGRRRDEGPGVVLDECIVFVLHGLAPSRITKCSEVIVRERRGHNGREVKFVDWGRETTGGAAGAMDNRGWWCRRRLGRHGCSAASVDTSDSGLGWCGCGSVITRI
jgi:hypothetical protein